MKKELLHWAFLLVAVFALGACGGDDAEDTPTPSTPSTPSSPTGKWSVTVKASVDETRGLSLSGNTLKVNWSTSETVYAYYNNVKVGELHPTANSNNGNVTLMGDLDTQNYTNGTNLTLKFPRETKDYTGQAGTIEDIATKFDFLEATATISDVNTSACTMIVGSASFVSQQAIVRLTFNQTLQSGDVITIAGAANNTAVSVTLASAPADGHVYVALPLTSTPTTYSLGVSVRRGNGFYDGTLANKILQNNKYYAASVTLGTYMEAVQLWEGGQYWATMNVGASSATDYGLFFAWGETTGYSSVYANPMTDRDFSLANYVLYNTGLTKYNNDSKYGTVDDKVTLEAADDAARANWGGTWRMPTKAEFQDLIDNTTHTWQYNYKSSGVAGYLFTGKDSYSGKSIFFPAAGYRENTGLLYQGSGGGYWTSSVNTDDAMNGFSLGINSANSSLGSSFRYYGRTIRPVHD